MIHLVTWLPLPYHQVLCRSLATAYGGDFQAWFLERSLPEYPFEESVAVEFPANYLRESGYRAFSRAIARDSDAVVILGGWAAPMSGPILAITAAFRTPVFVWADHPHPRTRSTLFQFGRTSMLRVLSRTVAGFLACGRPTADYLVRHGVQSHKISVFPYWVEVPEQWGPPPAADPIQAWSRRTRLTVVTVGRHVNVKRIDVAIEAIARANRGRREPISQLVVVGDGDERSRLESRVSEFEAWPYVRFTGWLGPDAVRREINEADVLAATSAFEGYGVTVLEAMAAGRPILASEGVIAARDRDEGTGAVRFHPVGAAGHLATQIEELAGATSVLLAAGAAARATAEKWRPRRAADILDEAIRGTLPGCRIVEKRRSEKRSAT